MAYIGRKRTWNIHFIRRPFSRKSFSFPCRLLYQFLYRQHKYQDPQASIARKRKSFSDQNDLQVHCAPVCSHVLYCRSLHSPYGFSHDLVRCEPCNRASFSPILLRTWEIHDLTRCTLHSRYHLRLCMYRTPHHPLPQRRCDVKTGIWDLDALFLQALKIMQESSLMILA